MADLSSASFSHFPPACFFYHHMPDEGFCYAFPLSFSFCNQLADRISFGGKLCLIFRHNIPPVQVFVMVQVESMCLQFPAGLLNLLKRKFKQFFIVRFKLHTPVLLQNMIISLPVRG